MNFWKLTLFATATILVSTGIRNTVGLLVNPLVENTILSLTQVSMAMAIGQFTYGLFQPLGGLLMTKYKTFSILLGGAICLILGFLGVHFAGSALLLILCFGILTPAGAAASSFPILMGHISKSVPDEKRSFSGGLINAGLYFLRLLLIGFYIFAPKTTPVFIIFAVIAGLTFGATVPSTGAITARRFHNGFHRQFYADMDTRCRTFAICGCCQF
jgi:MFS family permease